MDESRTSDALDEIVEGVRTWLPDVDLKGLAITGRILRLARHLQDGREAELEAFGLTVGDFDMLATMRRRAADGSIKIKDLQRSSMLSSGGTTKRLDRLESAGLIARHPDPDDRRGTLVGLSEAGRDLVEAAMPAITRYESKLVAAAISSERSRVAVESGLRQMLIVAEAASAGTRSAKRKPPVHGTH